MLLKCTTESCNKWMHEQCIVDDALKAIYKFLGADKAHLPPVITKNVDSDDEGKRLFSPPETGTSGSAEHSINAEAKAAPSDAVHISMKDGVDIKQAAEGKAASAAPEDSLPLRPPETRATSKYTNTDTPSKPATEGESTPGLNSGRALKKGSKANGESIRPWEGLFEATLKTADVGLPLMEFKDLREGVVGGEKTWSERVKCLLCGTQVN